MAAQVKGYVPQTEYKKEYKGTKGFKAEDGRPENNLKSGEVFLTKSTYKDHTNGTNIKEVLVKEVQYEKTMVSYINQNHVKNPDVKPNLEKKNQAPEGDKFGQPTVFIRGKEYRPQLATGKDTEYRKRFNQGRRDMSADFAKPPRDNLEAPKGINAEKKTNYREKHPGARPDRSLDRQLFSLNKSHNDFTHPLNATKDLLNKNTDYQRNFNDRSKSPLNRSGLADARKRNIKGNLNVS